MPGPLDFTGQNIETTYQRILQTDGVNIYNGTGSLFLTTLANTSSLIVTASAILNTITFTKGDTSTFSITVDTGSITTTFATTGSNTFVGNQIVSGNIIFEDKSFIVNSWLYDYNTSGALAWSNRQLYDTSENTSVNWEARQLLDDAGNSSVLTWGGSSPEFFGTSSFAISASWAPTTLPSGVISSSQQISDFGFITSLQTINTGSFATTGSNVFIGTQIITGSIITTSGVTGSLFGTSSWAINAETASYVNPLTQNVIITGSLTVSGSSTFTNIGPAVFSGSVTGRDGFTGSFLGNLEGTASYVEFSSVDGLTTFSSSVSSRIVDLENFSSSLDATFATDAQLNAYTASANIRLDALEIESGSIRSSFNNFTASYTADSASFSSRVSASESDIAALQLFSSSLDATFATDAQLNAATASLSASISSLSSSYLNTSASFSSGIDANAGDITALSSSFVSFSSSYNTGSYTGSFTGDGGGLYNIPASGIVGLNLSQISSGSVSASISPNNGLQINTNTTVAGDLIIQGTASITYLNVTYESASVIYSSGSNQFGDAADDTQTLYGTVLIQTGSLTVTGSVTSTNGFTGSLLGTSSWATNAISSSHALTSISASYALSASHAISASYALTASFAVTSSYALNTVSASFATQALSSSFAQTASFAPNYVLTSVTSSMLAPYVLTSQTSSMFVASASYVSISNVDGFTVYSSSVSSRISSLENFSSSLDATFATDAQLNSYTSSANNRLNALEIESGSIRSDFNAFTSSYTTDSSSFASRISINAINITNLTSATSSYVLNSQTGSFILTSQTSSMSVASASVATSASYALTSISASYAMRADSAAAIDVFVFGSDVESYLLMSNVAGTTGVAIGGDADLRYNSSTNKLTVGSVSATSLTGSLFGTASWANNATTASYVLNAISSSFASTASFVQNAQTASYVLNAISSSFSSTASYVNTLNQNVLITGSLTVGTTSAGASENTLTLGPRDNGSEGGQLMLQAPGGTYTSASMWDNYANKTRLLRGTNAGSDAEVVSFNMHSKQVQFPAYNALNAFSGTPVAALGVDNGGNIITIQTGSGAGGGGGSTFSPGTNVDNRIITATGASPELNGEANLTFDGTSLTVTGEVTASGAIRSTANNQMYFRGGDDAEFWDINIANTVGIYGQQNADRAGLKLGSSGPTLFGSASRFGINTITPTQATLEVNGNVYATSFTGSLTGSLVGSLTGTASWASNAVTASFATSGGSPAFPYTGSAIISGSLTVTGSANVQGAIGISQALIERAEITISASGLYTVYSAPTSSYRGIFADYTLISTNPAGNARAGNIMSVLSGSQVRYTETRTSDIGNTAAAAVQVSLSGGNLNLELNVATVATTWNLVSLVRTI